MLLWFVVAYTLTWLCCKPTFSSQIGRQLYLFSFDLLWQQWEFKYQMGVASCNLELAAKKDEWADMVTMILNAKENSDVALKNLANLAAQALETVKQQLSGDELSWTSEPLRLEWNCRTHRYPHQCMLPFFFLIKTPCCSCMVNRDPH